MSGARTLPHTIHYRLLSVSVNPFAARIRFLSIRASGRGIKESGGHDGPWVM